ncbi:hypothetical protein Ct61P_13952 [Colletotrichum tofieldiae]|nr:hypothetical protein Ct61P_13952 [Colletotrichum tofieldiae]
MPGQLHPGKTWQPRAVTSSAAPNTTGWLSPGNLVAGHPGLLAGWLVHAVLKPIAWSCCLPAGTEAGALKL